MENRRTIRRRKTERASKYHYYTSLMSEGKWELKVLF
jgi:hypothetical protein